MLGAWFAAYAGAFLYGVMLVALDLFYLRLRVSRARGMDKHGIGAYILRSFLMRLAIYLLGVAVAFRLFDRTGVLLVGMAGLLAIPAGIFLAARLGKSSGG